MAIGDAVSTIGDAAGTAVKLGSMTVACALGDCAMTPRVCRSEQEAELCLTGAPRCRWHGGTLVSGFA